MKQKYVIICIVTIFLILGLSLTYAFIIKDKPTPTGKAIYNSPVKITYSNIESELSKNVIVNSLPKDSKILLKFYHFEGENRIIEKTYSVSKGSIEEKTIEDPEIILLLDSSYLSQLDTSNFCAVISKANQNRELGVEMISSKISLAWKYGGLLKYKDCFGY